MSLEEKIFDRIFGLANQSAILDWIIIFLADYLAYFLVFIAIVFLWKNKDWKESLRNFFFIALTVILSRGIFTETIRLIFPRQRPFAVLDISPLISQSATPALPSGHAAFYFALAFAVFYLNKRLGFWFLTGAVFMGMARILAGVHWPLDVVAGALVGLLSAILIKLLMSRASK